MKENMPNQPEKLIPSEPRLRGMDKVLTLLESEELPDGEKINWKDIHERVKPFHTMYEFTENVREAVREYVAMKIPKFKEAVPSIGELDDKHLLNALTHNWFEEIDDVEGERREILLTVAAHVVKRIETLAERKLLREADGAQLAELGVDAPIRDLLVDLLEVSAKADVWFTRYYAYSQLSGKPPEAATPTAMHLPGDSEPHTMAELFPHEAQFMARRFKEIADKGGEWEKRSGGDAFVKYAETLSRFFEAKNPADAEKLQKEITGFYRQILETDFPVLARSVAADAPEGYYKEPYIDPELKIAVSTHETQDEENGFRRAKGIMAESLGEIGADDFADAVRRPPVRNSIVLGGFGVNLAFNSVAEEDPGYVMYWNEQRRAYDLDFLSMSKMVENGESAFAAVPEGERGNFMEQLSRLSTMMHEFGHPVYASDTREAGRLGERPLTVIDEVKAETLWRALTPSMREKGLAGSREQWAVAELTSLLLLLRDQPEGDEYFYTATYNLNDLFEKGIVRFADGKLSIADLDAYEKEKAALAQSVLSVYRDEAMTERKAALWIKKFCTPSPALEACIAFLKKEH